MKECLEVVVVMGSDSDLDKMIPSIDILKLFKVNYRVYIASAHRTPELVIDIAESAESKGTSVIIAGAGGSAHLAGMIASYTTIPVIGVPLSTKGLGGMDALYSMVQMPAGIPVATVGIDCSKNAGLMAISIMASGNKRLKEELKAYRQDMKARVEEKSSRIRI